MHIQVTLLAENAEKFALLCWKLCCITLNGINIDIVIFIVCRLHSFNFRYTGSCGVHHLWRQDTSLTTDLLPLSTAAIPTPNHPPDHTMNPLLCRAELCTCIRRKQHFLLRSRINTMLGGEQPTSTRGKSTPSHSQLECNQQILPRP